MRPGMNRARAIDSNMFSLSQFDSAPTAVARRARTFAAEVSCAADSRHKKASPGPTSPQGQPKATGQFVYASAVRSAPATPSQYRPPRPLYWSKDLL